MNEPRTEDTPAAEAETSREDKFFGVKTSIPEMLKSMKDEKPVTDDDFEEEEDKPKPKPLQAEEEEEGASDDDVEQYSKNVQKRIDRLTWEKKENERQRKAAEAARDEAFRIAKILHDQNQQQTEIITNGEARLIAEFKQRANSALQMANAAYKKAFEEGDSDGILKAQEQLFSAQSEVKAAHDYEQERKGREAQWKQQQQQRQQQKWVQQPQQQPQVRKATEEAENWAKRNPWFGDERHRDMTAVAYATHETMVRDKGIPPDSPQYFQTLDATMRARFPEYNFGDERPSSKPNAVVAPATRGRAASRKVKLNEHQRSLAKTLGISEELYARYSEMEMNRDK